jgi:hypothetical protein
MWARLGDEKGRDSLTRPTEERHNEDGRTKVDITYRFGPPAARVGEEYSADGKLNSLRLGKANPGRQTRGSQEGTARKKWQGFPVEKGVVRLRLME